MDITALVGAITALVVAISGLVGLFLHKNTNVADAHPPASPPAK